MCRCIYTMYVRTGRSLFLHKLGKIFPPPLQYLISDRSTRIWTIQLAILTESASLCHWRIVTQQRIKWKNRDTFQYTVQTDETTFLVMRTTTESLWQRDHWFLECLQWCNKALHNRHPQHSHSISSIEMESDRTFNALGTYHRPSLYVFDNIKVVFLWPSILKVYPTRAPSI